MKYITKLCSQLGIKWSSILCPVNEDKLERWLQIEDKKVGSKTAAHGGGGRPPCQSQSQPQVYPAVTTSRKIHSGKCNIVSPVRQVSEKHTYTEHERRENCNHYRKKSGKLWDLGRFDWELRQGNTQCLRKNGNSWAAYSSAPPTV